MDPRLQDLAARLQSISDEQERMRREHPPVIPDMPEGARGVVDFLIARSGLSSEWKDPGITGCAEAEIAEVAAAQGVTPDDPPVWYWLEGSPVPDQTEWSSWFDFLTDAETTLTWFLDSQKTRFEEEGEQPPGR